MNREDLKNTLKKVEQHCKEITENGTTNKGCPDCPLFSHCELTLGTLPYQWDVEELLEVEE